MAAISRDKIPAIGLTVIYEPKGEANLDVVFVHGFTGHPVRTWTHNGGAERLDQASEPPPKARKVSFLSRPHEQKKSTPSSASVYWPQDLLPKNLPHARVATFGYDTNIRHRHVGPVLNKSTIYDMAKDFLYQLEALRRSNSSRPLLFIAHSLGGIMVKEALRQAYNNQNRHIQLRQTFDSTIGILFFGTPHGGADPRGLVVGIIERLAKGLGFEANQHVLNTLLPDSECRQLRDEFNPVLQDQNWIIYSFQEGLALSGLGQKVVENSSSCLNFPKTEMTISIGKDHREMCRFSSVNDPQYQKVAAALDRIAEQVSVSPSPSDAGLPAPFPDKQEPPEATSLDHQSIQTLLDSLRFEQIDSRQESIRVAHKNTCVWITKTREYKDWLDINKMKDHHGFLWMRGKAGSGKSTLIKSTLRSFQNSKSSKGTTVIHFFFNARGAELEKTTRGMYRALLVQLLEILQKKMPHFQRDVFNSAAIKTWNVREGREWSVAILEELFENAILSIGQEEVTCFIDALDECDDEQVEPMIRLFERIGEQAVSNGLRFRIFFSSRPYPDISLDTCLNLLLDGQEGHVRDIKTYIQKELRAGDQQTKDQLLSRASGIFMWTVLVVDILNKEKRKGTPNHLVTKKLKKIPGDLWELFKSILNRDQEDKDQLLLCIQWLLFTRKPLGPEEFYHALLAGIETDDDSVFEDNSESDDYAVLGENSDSEHSPGFHVQSDPDKDSHSLDEGTSATGDALRATVPDIPRFIRSISKGLAEITQSEKAPVVQFIHESVRDFLLKEEKRGLRVVWPELGDDFEAQSHERLKQCCFQYYMRRDILTILSVGFDIALPKASAKGGHALRVKATETFPFLGYATLNVLWHAECAQTAQVGAISQQWFLDKDFDLRTWLLLRNLQEVYEARRYNSTYTASLLYVLAEHNLPALTRIYLPKFSALVCLATEQERYGSPVLAAMASKSRGAVDAFVDYFAALQQTPPSTVGEWRSETGTLPSMSTTSFRFSQKRGLLSYAAEYGDVALCHLVGRILDHEGINKRDQEGRTPLWYAARGGHSDVAKVLCQEGADPNIVGKNDISPLLSAVNNGHLKVVECLYREGANIEASSDRGTTPISCASKAGHVDIVKFLCGKCADINKPDSAKRGPISYASEEGHTAIVSFLVREGADLNAKDVDQNIPAVYAVRKGHMDCLKILVSSDSDFEAKNKRGETMLMMAVRKGRQKMAEWLLEHGASVMTVNQEGKSAMAYTLSIWNPQGLPLAQLINLKGRSNPHWIDDGGTSVFHYAAQQGDNEVLQSLLNFGVADINLRDVRGWTPLSHAVTRLNNHVTVKLLLDTGKVEVDSKDNDGRTPLNHAVTRSDNHATVKLLLDTGKVEVNSKDNDGRTPLSHAVSESSNETVKLLLDTGKVEVNSKDNDGRTPLSYAIARSDNHVTVKLLLDTGKVEVNSKDNGGRTPLSYAVARSDNHVTVKLLLDTGKVEVNSKDNDGRTPLSYAVARLYNHVTVKLLLATGKVEVNSKDNDGRTSLSHAVARSYNHATVKLLLDTGKVEVNSKDNDGRTPLSHAVTYFNNHVTVKLLLDTGKVEVNSKDNDGRTPLSHAVSESSNETVKLLLDTGKVEVNSKDNDGRTPLSHAVARSDNHVTVKRLLDTGKVEVNSKDNDGRTSLSHAVARSYNHVTVKRLLDTGKVEVNSKDNDGRTSLSHAVARSYNHVTVKLLLATGKVEVNSKDNDGRTPLSWAAGSGVYDCVKKLLLVGTVDVDARDLQGRTPLVHALDYLLLNVSSGFIRANVLKVITAFLKTGRVNVDMTDNRDRTALDIAAAIDRKEKSSGEGFLWWKKGNSVVKMLQEYKEGRFRGLPDPKLLEWR